MFQKLILIPVRLHKNATTTPKIRALTQVAPFRLQALLIDHGKEFTDRLHRPPGERTPTGKHAFEQWCTEWGIEHRLTRPKHLHTNTMIEPFNRRIVEILRTHHFRSGEELETTLLRYAWLYNHHLPQKALGHISPVQAIKHRQASTPDLFHQRVVNLTFSPETVAI